MNKKSLAKKIFNFKKNKKKITEEWKDEGLGNLQDILSGASFILTGRAKTIAAGLAAGVNLARTDLDRTGTIPSKSGNLETQGQILMGRALGLTTRRQNLQNAKQNAKQNTKQNTKQNAGNNQFGSSQLHAQNAVLFGALGNRTNPLLALGAVASGQSNNPFDDAISVLGSSEIGRQNADKITDMLGLPNIPGISKKRTEKPELGKETYMDITRAPTALAAISAANAMR